MLKDRHLPAVPVVEEQVEVVAASVVDEVCVEVGVRGCESDLAGSSEGQKKRTARGRRQRCIGKRQEEDEVQVSGFNSSGAPQLRSALNHAGNMRGKLPVAMLSHACDDRLPDLQAQARKLGWRIAPAKAVVTEGRGQVGGSGSVHGSRGGSMK